VRGEGVYLWDAQGKKYLDFSGSAVVNFIGHGNAEIVSAIAAANELASPTCYRIAPADHFAAIRTARARGLDVVGAYHSHPGSPAVPSATDLADAQPDLLYVIIGADATAGLDLRGWRLVDGNFREIPLVPVP